MLIFSILEVIRFRLMVFVCITVRTNVIMRLKIRASDAIRFYSSENLKWSQQPSGSLERLRGGQAPPPAAGGGPREGYPHPIGPHPLHILSVIYGTLLGGDSHLEKRINKVRISFALENSNVEYLM
jgi:hypothetical protein